MDDYRILLVDDEENILSSIRRQLRGKYNLEVALSGNEGIRIVDACNDIALVMSDYKMPSMNGVEFLSKIKEMRPDVVRMMLTGQADMEAVTKVINEGNIFRFITKPCPPDLLVKNINDGLEQYRLIHAEKELLTKTLGGTLKVLADLLVLAKPQAFSRGLRIRDIIKRIISKGDIVNTWQIEIAAMLSQIGCITVPDKILLKVIKGTPMTNEERRIYQQNIRTSSDMLRRIPRLEAVADIILYQEKYYDGMGFPADLLKGEDIPLGSRIMRLAIDFDRLILSGMDEDEAFNAISNSENRYDDAVVEMLKKAIYQP